MDQSSSRPCFAVFSGASGTIQNTAPLVTSNKARQIHELPLLTADDGLPMRFDMLRPQRLAAPVTVYIKQFSAHPLERDAATLYGPPDGYVNAQGEFHRSRISPEDIAVYEVVLRPEDGLYPLPYMARQANGAAWDNDCAAPGAPPEACRQPFYPDAARLFEEIDRLGVSEDGIGNSLSSRAEYVFYRTLPPGGYTHGLARQERTDTGEGDIGPETLGQDFFPYRPFHFTFEGPTRGMLAHLTNCVQNALPQNHHGILWLEGSPRIEETAYWLNLLIDTTLPIVCTAAQRVHGVIGNDGDHNIVDAVDYLRSRIWSDAGGQNRLGVVVITDTQIFTAREVQKADARPGGYIATGGHGGIIGTVGASRPPTLSFLPLKQHTFTSLVNMRRLPAEVQGVQRSFDSVSIVSVKVKNAHGELLPSAIPSVTILKHATYLPQTSDVDAAKESDILARIEQNLADAPLSGFVAEGAAPYGTVGASVGAALERAIFSGMPVVRVGRGNADGFTPVFPGSVFLSGSNLTATKARLLLMACLMTFGCLPPAGDPANPSKSERKHLIARLAQYQAVFDTH